MNSDEVIEWVQSLGPTTAKRKAVIQSILTFADTDGMTEEDREEAKLGLSLLELLEKAPYTMKEEG